MHLLGKNNFEFLNEELGYNYDYEFPYLHSHDYWEFIYTIHPIVHHINGNTLKIDEPSILIIKPEDYHSVDAVPPPVNPKKYPTVLNLKISENILNTLLSGIRENIVSKMHNTSFQPKKYHIRDLFDHLINLKLLPQKQNSETMVCSLIKAAVLTITLQYIPQIIETNDDILKTDPPEVILKIAKKLSSQSYFNRTIEDVTKSSFYSKMQLTRLFKKNFSMTMNEYFLNQKLTYAKTKLRYSKESILKISLDIGMSLPHFDSFFKQKTGMTPLGFRKSIKQYPENRKKYE